MAGQGTGRPIFFRCWKCRRRAAPFWDAHKRGLVNPYHNDGHRVKLTGRSRFANPRGNAQGRSDIDAREYECLTCGYIGWSRHTDLRHQENRSLETSAR